MWKAHHTTYILAISLPGGWDFLSKLKNREKFEGGLREKGREKKKKEKSDKIHIKYIYEA